MTSYMSENIIQLFIGLFSKNRINSLAENIGFRSEKVAE